MDVVWSKILVDLGLIFILVLLNGFFAAAEFALVSVDKGRLQDKSEDGNKKAKLLLKVTENSSRFLSTIQIGITLAGFLASASAAVTISKPIGEILEATGLPFIATYSQNIAIVIGTIILSFITLVLGELVPKRLALEYTEKVAFFSVKPINFLSKIMKPAVFILTKSTNFVARLLGSKDQEAEEKITEREIRRMIYKGERYGAVDKSEREMIEGIFEFDDRLAREVMTPRTNICAINKDTPIEDIIDFLLDKPYSRAPIYDEDIDNIIGIVHIKDLFQYDRNKNKEEKKLEDIMLPVNFVPETKNIDVLYREMQANKAQMSIVIDEYGGVSGLITIEDLVEEIVGDIFDEYDESVTNIKKIDTNVYLVRGLEGIHHINDELGLELPSQDYDTIGGFILHLLDEIPKVGETPTVEYKNILFKVEEIKEKRIEKIRLTIQK